MAILRAHDVQQLTDVELQEQMAKLRMELVQHYGKVSAGGATENPRAYPGIRRTIARLMTEEDPQEPRMISCQNVIRHELIGLDVLVSGAANPFHREVYGHIIDETRNLVVIQTHTGIKKIPKLGEYIPLVCLTIPLLRFMGPH